MAVMLVKLILIIKMKKLLYIFLFLGLNCFSQSQIIASQNKGLTSSVTPVSDTELPSSPTNLVASNATSTTINLTWTASTDNVGVVVYKAYDSDIFLQDISAAVTSTTLTGLNSNTAYNLTIRAVDAANNESGNSNLQSLSTLSSQFTSSRFLMMGDSVTYSAYFFPDQIESQINSSFPSETVEVVMMGSPGESIDSYATGGTPNVDSYLATVSDIATVQTFCVVMLGTNDARVALYENLTQTQIDTKIANLNYIVDAIEAKGFVPIILNAPWSMFEGSFSASLLGPAYIDESKGTKPYNDNIIKPVILNRTPNYAFADGTSYMQPYELFYNGHDDIPSYSGDGVHPSGDGYAALKQHFVDALCSFIFTGTPPTRIIKDGANMAHEQAYFDATYVSPANASTIQSVLDSDGAVRLGSGDYTSSGNITMTSNQRLYGWIKPNGTKLGGDINISAGSTNVHIEDIEAENEIRFVAGSPITNSTIKSIYYSEIECHDCQMENNEFIDLNRVTVDLDCSTSGYFRNNTWTRVFAQSINNHVEMIGNDVTPSYGNVELSRNLLNSSLSTTEYRNLDSHTVLGNDAEFWNATGQTPATAAWYFRDIGTLKFFNSFGYSTPAAGEASEFNFEADKIIMSRRSVGSGLTPQILAGSDLLYIDGGYTKPALNGDAWGFFGHHSGNTTDINGSDISSAVTGTDATNLNALIYDTEYTPFARPNLPTLPDPTGSSWATDRIGQTDQSAAIQALIDANGVAELDEGIYYISQSLIIENGEGIVGKGTGKTVIVGITDDFPLILAQDDVSGGQITGVTYPLAYLTLQGGSKGLHIDPIGKASNYLQITSWNIKNVVFRNQASGIHFDQFYAMDNTFINAVSFVDCAIGINQDPLLPNPNPNGSGEYSQNMYIDKSLFYECQFINCTTALSMNQTNARPNNLNAWVNCKFDSNDLVMDIGWNNAMYFANTDFTNNDGTYLFSGGSAISFYSCDFTGNSNTATFDIGQVYAEGCNFNDSNQFFNGTSKELYLWNSNVSSTINTSDINQGFSINNSITGNSALSKPMVEIISGSATTILDGVVDVYPQLLVKQ